MVKPLFDVPTREHIRALVRQDEQLRQQQAAMPPPVAAPDAPAPEARNPRSGTAGPLTIALENAVSGVASTVGEAYRSWGVLTPEEQAEEQGLRREEARQAELTNRLLEEQKAAERAEIAKAGYEMPGQFQTMGDRNVADLQEKAEGPPPTLSKARSGSDAFLRTLAQSTLSVAQAPGIAADSVQYLVTGDENESGYVQKLDEVSKAIKAALPGDPTRNGELFEGLAQGTGSLTSIMAGGLATKVLGLGVKAGATVLGSTAAGVGGYEDAKAHNASTTAKYLSFYANSALGLIERIPIANAIDRAFGELNKATNGRVVEIIASGTVNSLEELIQEVGQSVGQNAIAKMLYDNEREIFEGVGDQATVASILGFFFGAGTTALSQAMNRPANEPVQPYQPRERVEPVLPQTEPLPSFEEVQQQLNDLTADLDEPDLPPPPAVVERGAEMGDPNFPLATDTSGAATGRFETDRTQQVTDEDVTFVLQDPDFALDGVEFRVAKDVLARTPELQDGIRKLKAGEITKADFAGLVNRFKPVTPYAVVPTPATPAEMANALTEDKVPKIGAPDQLQEGHPVGLRLDIPAYARHGTWVVSVHEQKAGFAAGAAIGYSNVARATNVDLGVVQNAAVNIAGGKPKATIATMKGSWKPATPEQAKADADAALQDSAWRQIGMDPERHAFFYDRETMQPITAAEEVIQIGPLVLGKNVTYADPDEFEFQTAKVRRGEENAEGAPDEEGADVVETAGEPVPDQAVDIASLDSANNVSKSRVWDTGRQLKMALQNAILNAVNGANLLERTAENRAFLVKVGVKDAFAALAQNGNAIGWYDLKTRQALAVMSLVHPELATDETSRFAFTWALATTSNGIKVDKNFELAEMVYSRWKASNKDPAKRIMPTDVKAGKAQKPINKSLQLFNDLSQAWGLTPLRLFMLSNFKAGDIKAMTGIMPTGEWAKTDVRGASVIGPKIGNGFFSNLYGKFDALTMDRWLVRTWGRWTGTLIEIDQPNVDISRTRLREAIKGLDRDGLIKALRAVTKTKTNKKTGVETVSEVKPKDRERLIEVLRTLEFGRGKGVLEAASDSAIDALSDAVLRASQEPKFRDAMNSVRGGEELRKAGNGLAKYLDGQKEQPEGPGERVYIREIFSEMLSELQQDPRYKDLTMSDLQAVLWYAEKRLYETAKEDLVAADVAALEGDDVAGYDDDDAPDYANAAAKVAREKGVTDRRINAALKKEEDRGRSDNAQPDAGGAGPGASSQAGQGQQGQARGFTASERREFVQRRALDRVRSNRSGDEAASWSYARAGGEGRGGPGLLKKASAPLGATVTAVWSPGKGIKQVFGRAEIKTPDIFELETGSAENAARFVSAISSARDTLGPIGKAVYIYPNEDYAGMRLFLAGDGKAGFALKPDGDIVSVFSSKGTGAGRAVMETAIAAGGKKLDCFDTILPDFYSAHGFKGAGRLLWDDGQAPEGWDKAALAQYNNGEPDVVFMVYDPAYKAGYDQKGTPLFKGDPENDYGRALKAQAKVVKAVAKTSPRRATDEDTEALIPRQAGSSLSGEPQRPAGVPDTGQTQEEISLSAMAANLVRLMNLTFRTGRVTAGRDALGQYNKKTGVIRARQRNDFSTLVHESGHALNDARSAELTSIIDANQNEISQVALRHYGAPQNLNAAQLKREGFAEFFRFYVTNPQLAQQETPQFYRAFDGLIQSADPNLYKGLMALRQQVAIYSRDYPSTEVVKSFVKSARERNLWDPRDLADTIAEESQNARPYEGKPTAGGFFDWVRRGMFDMGSQAYTALVDQNNGVRKLTYALLNVAERNNKKVDLKDTDNPLELLAKASNSFMPAHLALQYGVRPYKSADPVGPSLRDGIAVMMGSSQGASYFDMNEQRLADANAYLVALRAVEEYQRFAAGELQNPPVGFSEADARQAVRDFEAKYGQSFKDGAKMVHRYARNLLDKEFEAGLISPETYDEIKDKPAYVPLLRDMSDRNREFGDNVMTSGKTALIKRFRGSSRDIIAPLDALMHRTFASEKRIAENETIKAMAKLAQKAGLGAGALVEKIPAATVERIQVQMEDVFQKIIDDPNISPADAAIMQGIFQASFGGDEVMQIFRSTMLNERGERILTYRENGKLQAIQLGDDGIGESVFNVMRGLGDDKVPLLLDLASMPSRALRFGITKWPDFLLVNYFRDQFMAGVSTNVGYIPFASGAKGMWDVVRKKKAFLDYSAAMGIMGGVAEYQVHKARVAQDIEGLKQKGYIVETFEFDGFSYKTLGGLVKGIFRLSELAEAGTRVGLFNKAYKRAVAEGLTEYDAIQEASRIARDYIDFGRVGSKMAAANRLIPFLNANVQGLDVTIRKLGGGGAVGRKALAFMDENRTAPRLQAFVRTIAAVTDGQRQGLNLSRVELNDLKNAQAMWMKMTALALMSAAIFFAFKDDEDYQEASPYLRQTGWLIPLGDGRLFYAPKPFEIALLGNFMERAIEYAYGDEEALGKFWENFTSAVTPPFVPPIVSIATGLGANLNISFGKPREVVPGYLERLPPEQRALATSTEIAKQIGEAIGYPPAKIDFLITSLFGSMGRDVSGALDGVINPDRAEKGVDDSFITRRFVRDATRGGMSAEDFNALANRMNGSMTQASAGYKRYIDVGDMQGAAEYLANLTEDERAWAILDRHFDAKLKRLHPIYRANQVSTIVSGVRREVLTAQLKDSQNEGEFILLTAKQKRLVDDFVTDIQRRERRNALIAIGHPSWKSKQPLDIQPSLDLLREVSPEAADELDRRFARAKMHDGADLAANWPEVKQRLLDEGPEAILTDLIP
jgi:hypothetical protein